MNRLHSIEKIIKNLITGDRVTLGKAITLVESKNKNDQILADKLIGNLVPDLTNTLRIGVTGIPGAGKSTFIEALGEYIIEQGHQLAVLTIDPTSHRSKGSILGDKTRMQLLSANKNAFIRPSPSGDRLGGIANRTKESILLCEAAGFDVVIIETVGVGQGEIEIENLVDFCLLLAIPGGGDELQGIKRGIMEIADMMVINKADGANSAAAQEIAQQYRQALHLFPKNENDWITPVTTCSSIEKTGIDHVWEEIEIFRDKMIANGHFEKNRHEQDLQWFHSRLKEKIEFSYFENQENKTKIHKLEQRILDKTLTVNEALSKI